VSVVAWGLSLERPTMIKYGIKTIRTLFGPTLSVDFVKQGPICLITTAGEHEEKEKAQKKK
jgi:phenylalanyl-tRNA synthetase alpha chain